MMKNNAWGIRISATAVTAAALGAVLAAAPAGTAMAQEVIFTGEPAPLTVYRSYAPSAEGEDAEGTEIEVQDLHVLGGVSAGEDADLYAAVMIPNEDMGDGEADEQTDEQTPAEAGAGEMPWITGFVLSSEIMEKIPSLSFSELPTVTGWTDLGQGAGGDLVIAAQKELIDLGFLEGTADGVYGSGTAGAVSAFQQENGLPATGVLDAVTYLYLDEQAKDREPLETPYPPVYTVEDKFDDIVDDVEDASVLEAYVKPEWNYSFDAFEGEGLITEGTVLGTYEDSSRPVDTISLTVSPVMKVKRLDTGMISVYPILQVKSIGAYRPYVSSIILKAGNAVCELGDAELSGALTGTQVEETAEIPVSPESLEKLTGSEDAPLEIRVKGNSRTYDLDVKAGVEELVEAVGQE